MKSDFRELMVNHPDIFLRDIGFFLSGDMSESSSDYDNFKKTLNRHLHVGVHAAITFLSIKLGERHGLTPPETIKVYKELPKQYQHEFNEKIAQLISTHHEPDHLPETRHSEQ